MHLCDSAVHRRQLRATGKRRTCSASLSELICGPPEIITAHRHKIIALVREEQVRLLPYVRPEFRLTNSQLSDRRRITDAGPHANRRSRPPYARFLGHS
jgi:hypothetical protein